MGRARLGALECRTAAGGDLKATAVFLVEDDLAYAHAVAEVLDRADEFRLCERFSSADECNVNKCRPGSIWLIDLGLPGNRSGLDLIRPITNRGGLVLVASVFEDETRVLAAIQHGAQGYFVKGDGNLLETIRMIQQGQAYGL